MTVYIKLFGVFILLIATFISGCGGSGGSDSNTEDSLIEISSFSLPNLNAISGTRDIVVAQYTDYNGPNYPAKINLYQQDNSNTENLLNLSTIYLGVDTLYKRLTFINSNHEWVSVALNHNFENKGWAALVSLTQYGSYALDVFLPIANTINHIAAQGDWLLVTHNNSIDIYDITNRVSPVLHATFPNSLNITEVTAMQSGFILFTSNGYTYLDHTDPSNITITDYTNTAFKSTERAYLDGTSLYFGGASINTGKSQFGKLNVSDPHKITVDFVINNIEGEFEEFSYDSASHCYIVSSKAINKHNATNGALIYSTPVEITQNPETRLMHATNEHIYTGDVNGPVTIWKY